MSGTDEEYGERERLLTKLQSLQQEREKAQQPGKEAEARASKARAEALEEDECKTLSKKKELASTDGPPSKKAQATRAVAHRSPGELF